MRVGFDLDGVFIDKPPFVPRPLIEWLYRGPQKNGPSYRLPNSKVEISIRQLSHFWFLRPKIVESIEYLRNRSRGENVYYLISSRYSFLQKRTKSILKRYKIGKLFDKVCLNIKDEQPHKYKERMIKRLKIQTYIDDDIRLLKYLRKACPGVQLVWYNREKNKKDRGVLTIYRFAQIGRFI